MRVPVDGAFYLYADVSRFTEYNQKTAAYRPCGWGKTLLEALSECIKAVNKFRYET